MPPKSSPARFWQCAEYSLPLGAKTYVMAILNATPDSFSGDGLIAAHAFVSGGIAINAIFERAKNLIAAGADILDIGGESTRPGAPIISEDEELRRVIPMVEALAPLGVPLSIDTTKSAVARRALQAGASIINDISGATHDPQMPRVLSESNCGIVLMHRRANSQAMRWSEAAQTSTDVIEEILSFWRARLEAMRALQIDEARLCFDAGFGFGKSVEENLDIVRRGDELSAFGFPTLSAVSRKSTIARVLQNGTEAEYSAESAARLFGTMGLTALAIEKGADIVRVHDVQEMAHLVKICDAVVRTNAIVRTKRQPGNNPL